MKKLLLAILLISFASGAHASESLTVPTISFTDKTNQSFSNNYGWDSAQMVAANRAVALGTSTARYPNSSVQYTVNPGDNSGLGNERNEFLEMFGSSQQDESLSPVPVYYAISIRLPDTFTNDGGVSTGGFSWDIFTQLHGPDSGGCGGKPPFIALLTQCRNPNDICGGIPPTHMMFDHETGSCSSPIDGYLDLGAYTTNVWMDFVWKVIWANDNTGLIDAWTRLNETGPLLHTQLDGVTPIVPYRGNTWKSTGGTPVTTSYWKTGVYTNHQNATITIMNAGPLCRALTLQDAALCAFGSYP